MISKKRQKIYAAVFSLVILTGLVLLILHLMPPRPVELKVFFHLYTSPAKAQLAQALNDFSAEYPYINLEYHINPYQDMRKKLLEELGRPDEKFGIVSVLAGKDLNLIKDKSSIPAPWISSTWNLFYNSKRLESFGYTRDDLFRLSNQGLKVFSETLEQTLPDDEYVFSVGTAFYWPWLSWIQHLEILEDKGRSPVGYSPEDWKSGIDSWDKLVEDRFINPDFSMQNFASSQLAVSTGKSLFVLSDSSIYSTYPPAERSEIDSIPFPGTTAQKWQIGSGYYLSGSFRADEKRSILDAEDLLISYLHSDEVRDRFLRNAGIRLLSKESKPALRDIPSLTQRAGDPELQDLLKFRK